MTQTRQDLVLWELHAHTAPTSICAHMPAEEVVRGVLESGCYGLVITDHYNPERFAGATRGAAFRDKLHELFAGYREAKEAGDRLGLTVLPGSELRIEAGDEDYLLYGINEEMLAEAGFLADLSLARVREILSPMGALIVQAHPFRRGQFPAAEGLLDGIEVYNGNPRHDSRNHLALELALERGLIQTRGSDIHQKGDFGLACVMLPPVKDEAELALALKQSMNN